MRSWRQSGTRFFATALVGGNPANLLYIWVTAATHLEEAKKYRAEIRLASNRLPECTAIYYNPGRVGTYSTKCYRVTGQKGKNLRLT